MFEGVLEVSFDVNGRDFRGNLQLEKVAEFSFYVPLETTDYQNFYVQRCQSPQQPAQIFPLGTFIDTIDNNPQVATIE